MISEPHIVVEIAAQVIAWLCSFVMICGALTYRYQHIKAAKLTSSRIFWGNFDSAVIVFCLDIAVFAPASNYFTLLWTRQDLSQAYQALSVVLAVCLLPYAFCQLYILKLRTKAIMDMKWYYKYTVYIFWIDFFWMCTTTVLLALFGVTKIYGINQMAAFTGIVAAVLQLSLEFVYSYNFIITARELKEKLNTLNYAYYKIVIRYGLQITAVSLVNIAGGSLQAVYNNSDGNMYFAGSLTQIVSLTLNGLTFHAMKIALRKAQIEDQDAPTRLESFLDYDKITKGRTSNMLNKSKNSAQSKSLGAGEPQIVSTKSLA